MTSKVSKFTKDAGISLKQMIIKDLFIICRFGVLNIMLSTQLFAGVGGIIDDAADAAKKAGSSGSVKTGTSGSGSSASDALQRAKSATTPSTPGTVVPKTTNGPQSTLVPKRGSGKAATPATTSTLGAGSGHTGAPVVKAAASPQVEELAKQVEGKFDYEAKHSPGQAGTQADLDALKKVYDENAKDLEAGKAEFLAAKDKNSDLGVDPKNMESVLHMLSKADASALAELKKNPALYKEFLNLLSNIVDRKSISYKGDALTKQLEEAANGFLKTFTEKKPLNVESVMNTIKGAQELFRLDTHELFADMAAKAKAGDADAVKILADSGLHQADYDKLIGIKGADEFSAYVKGNSEFNTNSADSVRNAQAHRLQKEYGITKDEAKQLCAVGGCGHC